MVIYFTGTGNSQYVAEAIGHHLSDQVVSANQYIKSGEKGCFQSEKPWVFVYPVYISTMAKLFADFIRGCKLEGNQNAYFVGTCASEMGSAANCGQELCKLQGLEYRGTVRVQMPQNYIALFKMTEQDEIDRRIQKALEDVVEICKVIQANENLDMKLTSGFEYAMVKVVEKIYNGPFTGTKKFYATDECVGCGLCEKVCPMNNVTMQDGKPKWKKSCVHCMACINHCPKKAIEYGKKTVGVARYVCPQYHITPK